MKWNIWKSKELNNTKYITVFAFYILMFFGVIYLFTTPIETSGSIECNSGSIGLDLDTHIEEINKSFQTVKGTFIDRELQLDNLSINNISGLSCKGSFSGKIPVYMLLWGI